MIKTLGAVAAFLLTFSIATAQVIGPARGGTGTSTVPQKGYVLIGQTDGTYAPRATSSLGIASGGSVTSVGFIVPTGFTASGSPVTSTGNLELLFASGYGPMQTASSTEWHSYYTNPSSRITAGTGIDWSGNTLNVTLGDFTTSNLSEGSNLYYTDARARAAITEDVLGLQFTSGVLGTSTGYFLPTTTRAALWDLAHSWGNHASAGYITDGNTGWDNSYGFLTEVSTTTVRGMFSQTVPGLTYTSSTGVTSLDAGYTLPTTSRAITWDTAYSWGNHASAGYITDGNTNWDNSYGFITDGNTGWDNSYGFITASQVIGTSTIPTQGYAAYWTSETALGSVATGSLTESAEGLEFNATRGLFGGSATLSISSGYAVPTTSRLVDHDTAYSWGNHAVAGYLTVVPTTTVRGMFSETVDGLTYTSSTGVTSLDSGYAIPTTTRLTNHDAAFGWGNHASAGYLTANQTITLSGDVTGSGETAITTAVGNDTHDHTTLTISGLDISADTNLTAGNGLTFIDDDLNCDTASGSTFGCLASADWTAFNAKVSSTSIDTSSELSALLSDETGSGGSAVFSSGPTLTGLTTLENFLASNGTTTNATSTTGWFSSMLRAAQAIVTSLTATDATTTNATTTNLSVSTLLKVPYSSTETVGVNGDVGIDSTSNQFKYSSNGVTRVLGNGNIYPAFTLASTTWAATATRPIGSAYVAETWNGVQCWSIGGTGWIRFGDGSNWTNATITQALPVGTAVPTFTLSSNNTFTSGEQRFFQYWSVSASSTEVTCTVSKSLTAD